MRDLLWCSLADSLREFAEFFTQPGNGRGNTAISVAFAVGRIDHRLKFSQIHAPTVSLADD